MNLTFVTPEKKILVNQPVESVVVPGFRGELDIRQGHAPLMTTMKAGVMRWKAKSGVDAGKEQKAVVTWGYCEVSPDGVKVLADIVDFPDEIDAAEAKQNLQSAEKKLASQSLSEAEFENLEKEVARMNSQLQLMKELGKGT